MKMRDAKLSGTMGICQPAAKGNNIWFDNTAGFCI